ncbi:MAG: hypothetical protein HY360_22565 [Verrucomicrobia bacterium]|nr:hypothetical protein [Verrucomicrobiota bacterium]
MRENLCIVLITVALFVGGLLTGVWTQKIRPMPAPPMQPWGEFQGKGMGNRPPDEMGNHPPDRFNPQHQQMREAMEEKMRALQPEMEAFQGKLKTIEENFQQKLTAALNSEQKQKFQQFQRQAQERPQPHMMGGRQGPPPSDQQRGNLREGGMQPRPPEPMGETGAHQRPGGSGGMPPPGGGMQPHRLHPGGGGGQGENPLLNMVLVKSTLDDITETLKLDSKQQAEVKSLLLERRAKMLALIDETPPPTVKMGKIFRETMGRAQPPPDPRPPESR